MIAFIVTIIAALLGASFAAPTKPTLFKAKTQVVNGNSSLEGLYITGYHTGAGQSAAVASPGAKDAGQFEILNSTYIAMPAGGNYVYFLNLDSFRPQQEYDNGEHFRPAAPKGYRYTDINLGAANTPGFSINKRSRVMDYQGNRTDFATFAVCNVVDSLGGYGNGTELLWRTTSVKPDKTGQCADVTLKVQYVS